VGSTHLTTLSAVYNLAESIRQCGRPEEAEELHRRALQGRETSLGPKHVAVYASAQSLGDCFYAQGEGMKAQGNMDSCNAVWAKAEEYYQRALIGRHGLFGALHTDTCVTMQTYATLLHEQGRDKDAEPLVTTAVTGFDKCLGEDHDRTFLAVRQLGIVLLALGKLAEAEQWLKKDLAATEKLHGLEDVSTLACVGRLGFCQLGLMKWSQSIPLLRRTLADREERLGLDHFDTLATVTDLACCLQAMAKVLQDLGIAYEEEYDAILMQQKDDSDSDDEDNMRIPGEMLMPVTIVGSLEEAEDLQTLALEHYDAKFKSLKQQEREQNPLVVACITNLFSALLPQERYDVAEPLHRRDLARCQQQFGKDNVETIERFFALAECINKLGEKRLEDAEMYYRMTVEGADKVLGVDDPTTLDYCAAFTLNLMAQGKTEEVEGKENDSLTTHLKRVLAGYDKQYEMELYEKDDKLYDRNVAFVTHLANLLLSQEKHADAEPYLIRLLEHYETKFDEHHELALQTGVKLLACKRATCDWVFVEGLLQKELGRLEGTLGKSHEETLNCCEALADLWWTDDLLKVPEQLPLRKRVLDGRDVNLGKASPVTYQAICKMLEVLLKLGRDTEAIAINTRKNKWEDEDRIRKEKEAERIRRQEAKIAEAAEKQRLADEAALKKKLREEKRAADEAAKIEKARLEEEQAAAAIAGEMRRRAEAKAANAAKKAAEEANGE